MSDQRCLQINTSVRNAAIISMRPAPDCQRVFIFFEREGSCANDDFYTQCVVGLSTPIINHQFFDTQNDRLLP